MNVDYLSVTMSESSHHEVLESLTPIIASLGIASAFQGLFKLHSGGTLKTGAIRGSAFHVSASGAFLQALRAESLYHDYLAILSLVPCRVTRMDIAHDVSCDAPLELKRFKTRVESGEISLTRKKLDLQTQYNCIFSHDRNGRESGTIYLGPKSVQVAGLKVYDKSKEQYDKFARDIPPTLRWELKLGRKAGLNLRDAWEPDPVFWHFMSDILPRPGGVPTWNRFPSEVTLPPRTKLLPAESMKRLVESADLVSRLMALSELIGPHGFDYLVRLLRDRYQTHTNQHTDSDSAPVRAEAGS